MYYDEPNVERLSKLRGLTEDDIGKQVAFCPKCLWQLDLDAACKPVCPVCRHDELHVSRIDEDLLELIRKDTLIG